MNRRELLPSMVAGLAAGSTNLIGVSAAADHVMDPMGISEFMTLDPVENFRQAMRLQRSLEDADDILHWYHFIMVAVPHDATPKAVVRWEGIELSRHQILSENRYRMHGHNLSFPRDLKTGQFGSRQTQLANPKNAIEPHEP